MDEAEMDEAEMDEAELSSEQPNEPTSRVSWV
jgi:hypothetical protein